MRRSGVQCVRSLKAFHCSRTLTAGHGSPALTFAFFVVLSDCVLRLSVCGVDEVECGECGGAAILGLVAEGYGIRVMRLECHHIGLWLGDCIGV